MDKVYTKYYLLQAGGGMSDIGHLYVQPHILQSGSGIGSIFSGLFKFLRPMISTGLNEIKNQSFKTGAAILRDASTKPIKEVLKEQGKLAVQDLAKKGLEKLSKPQEGTGCCKKTIKRRHDIQNFNHSISPLKRKRRQGKRILDIFN